MNGALRMWLRGMTDDAKSTARSDSKGTIMG